MQNRHLPWTLIVLVLVFGTIGGCRNQEESGPGTGGETSAGAGLQDPGAVGVSPETGTEELVETTEPEEPPPTVAEVHLTDQLQETCLVAVDDLMPEGELLDTSGNPQQLTDLYGDELTVVLCWTVGDSPWVQVAATNALADLEDDVATPYGQYGVSVVSINVHNSPEVARECISSAEVTLPTLIDSDGAYFGLVATEKMPRIYLLDSEGKILWFDVEFTATTRRQLVDAIRALLGDPATDDEDGAATEGGAPA